MTEELGTVLTARFSAVAGVVGLTSSFKTSEVKERFGDYRQKARGTTYVSDTTVDQPGH